MSPAANNNVSRTKFLRFIIVWFSENHTIINLMNFVALKLGVRLGSHFLNATLLDRAIKLVQLLTYVLPKYNLSLFFSNFLMYTTGQSR